MNLLKRLSHVMILWVVTGMCYAMLELFWRGVTYLPMVLIGGLAGTCVGILDGHLMKRMWAQCLVYTAIALVVEFLGGWLFNLRLGLHIWDYSTRPFNIMGQVCLLYAVLWFLLMPFAIWMIEWLRWKLFSDPPPANGPFKNYVKLFTGK